MITPFWEIDVFIYLSLAIIVGLLIAIGKAWRDDEKKWRHVAPHYGSTFDGRMDRPRSNVRRIV